MHKTVEVICAYCGNHFQRDKYHANKSPNSYCNDLCRGLAKRKRLIRVCATCGKEYETTSKRSLKYCSRACGWQAQIGQERPYMKGRPGWATGRTKETDATIAKMAETLRIKPPPRDELYQLFTVENLPYKEIGRRFGVTSGTSKKWIAAYSLLRKRDLLTEAILQSLTDDNYTHRQMGEMYNCTGSYVGKIAKSFGIEAIHRPKSLDPDPDVLRRLYLDERLTLKQVGDQLGVDQTSIQNWLRRYNIPTRSSYEAAHPDGWKPPSDQDVCGFYVEQGMRIDVIGAKTGAGVRYVREVLLRCEISLRPSTYPTLFNYVAKDGHKVRSGLELQVDNWLCDHGLQHEYETPIGNTRYRTDFLVGDWYIEIWGLMGKPKYERKRDIKLAVYKQLGLNLLSIYPHDFPDLEVLSVLTSTVQLRLAIF